MKHFRPMSILLLAALVVISASSSSIYSQKQKNSEPLPKLLTVREQQTMRERWLKKRLDTMLLR